MRRIISATLVAVSLVAVTGVGAVAQSEPEQAIVPAGLNADKIDGRHAVGHGASARKRAGKLVATNKRGQLPSNIVKPAWRLILGKPAAFRDGQITWGEVQNKPGDFADGQIGWGEIVGIPAGFADGVDAGDKTSAEIVETSNSLAPGEKVWLNVYAPIGMDVGVTIIPVRNGATMDIVSEYWQKSPDSPFSLRHAYQVENTYSVASAVTARAVYWNKDFVSPAAANKAVRVEFHKKKRNR